MVLRSDTLNDLSTGVLGWRLEDLDIDNKSYDIHELLEMVNKRIHISKSNPSNDVACFKFVSLKPWDGLVGRERDAAIKLVEAIRQQGVDVVCQYPYDRFPTHMNDLA
ncbi:hypothetical protein AX15_004808 [Amanita polypyramis BW_CC]|nr:hypothetical protein AX15_004808 [Amanita polypyramis BW_CC]